MAALATIPALRDGLVTLLTGQMPSGGSIEGSWIPLEELATVKTSGNAFAEVIAGDQDTKWVARNDWHPMQRMQVGFYWAIDKTATAAAQKTAVDTAIAAVKTLADYVRTNKDPHAWSTPLEAAVTDVQIAPIFDAAVLRKHGLFASVITVTFETGNA